MRRSRLSPTLPIPYRRAGRRTDPRCTPTSNVPFGSAGAALIHQNLGRLEAAYREWQAALADNPSFVPSLLGCAELLLHLRRFEDAEAIAARLDHLAPDAATTLRGRLGEARDLLPA